VRFAAIVDIELPDDVVARSPNFWDRCRGLIGARVDLSTEWVRSRVEVATFLYEVRSALHTLGIDNARSLVVDDTVVFEDHKGCTNDLPELMTAFADHLLVQTSCARDVRLCVEHEEAGLQIEIEARMTLEHPREEPAARVAIAGRVFDLAVRPGEAADAYRRRVEHLVSDATYWLTLKVQFSAFLSRVEEALGASLPGATLKTTTRPLGLDLTAEVPVLPPPRETQGAERASFPAPSRTARRGDEQTAAPARNFSLSLEQRVAAAMAGPPRYAVRLRKIEDLQSQLTNELAVSERESVDAIPVSVVRGLDELNRLIDEHNRYYPIERNLPIDRRTGDWLLSGETWKPLSRVSIDALRHATAAMRLPSAP
jgi:hypothetical protein